MTAAGQVGLAQPNDHAAVNTARRRWLAKASTAVFAVAVMVYALRDKPPKDTPIPAVCISELDNATTSVVLVAPKGKCGLGHQLLSLFVGLALAGPNRRVELAPPTPCGDGDTCAWWRGGGAHDDYTVEMHQLLSLPVASHPIPLTTAVDNARPTNGVVSVHTGNSDSCCGSWCFVSRPYAILRGIDVLSKTLDGAHPSPLTRCVRDATAPPTAVWHFRSGDITLAVSPVAVARVKRLIDMRHPKVTHIVVTEVADRIRHQLWENAQVVAGRTWREDFAMLLSADILVSTGSSFPVMIHALNAAFGCNQTSGSGLAAWLRCASLGIHNCSG